MQLELEERGKRRLYRLQKGVTTVGRDLSCEISLASTSVSRRHAEFVWEGDALSVKDLGSRNGIRVNGKSVQSATLADGDRVTVGEVALVFRGPGRAGAPAVEAPARRMPTGDEDAPTPLDTGFSIPPAPQSVPGDAPAPSSPGFSPLKRRRLLVAAAGAAALTVLGGVAAIFLKHAPAAPPAPAYGETQYAADLMQVLTGFVRYEQLRQKGSVMESREVLAEARKTLRQAHLQLPQKGLAALLDRAMAYQESLGSDYHSFPHDDAYEAWESVKKFRGLDPEIEIFATQRQRWMDSENSALLALEAAQAKDLAGHRDEAIGEYRKVADSSLAYPAAREAMARLCHEGFAGCLAGADKALSRGGWDEALLALERSLTYAQDDADRAEVQRRRDAIQADRGEEADFNAARKAYLAGDYDQAKPALEGVATTSKFRAQADAMLLDMRRREEIARVQALFAEGKGEQALLQMEALPEGTADPRTTASLKDLISKVVAASREAEQHESGGRLLEAVQSWRAVSGVLPEGAHAQNSYRQRAAEFLVRWSESAIAAHHLADSKARIDKEDYAGARESLELARRATPGVALGDEEILKPIFRRVGRMKLEAYEAKRTGDVEHAREIMKQALAMLRPGDGDRGAAYEGVVKTLREIDAPKAP